MWGITSFEEIAYLQVTKAAVKDVITGALPKVVVSMASEEVEVRQEYSDTTASLILRVPTHALTKECSRKNLSKN